MQRGKVISWTKMDKPPKEKTARVFFALWPSEAEREALAAWQSPLRKLCGGRAMRAETLHNTLVFLGELPQAKLEALSLAAREVRGESFELPFDHAHYWGHNHIVHAAPHATPPQLAQLVLQLEQSLTRHRFRFDRRAYKPHVTLLRNARWNDRPLQEMERVVWRVGDFVLVQSMQDERGANYRVLERFELGGG